MAGKWGGCCLALVLGLCVLAPDIVSAGPYLGDWGLCWHDSKDCQRNEYCPLHYWTPCLYKVRAYVHPSNLDQYPPGTSPPVIPTFELNKVRCRTIPPGPTQPYADPAGYFGREVIPPP
jgi:hypothetical protein